MQKNISQPPQTPPQSIAYPLYEPWQNRPYYPFAMQSPPFSFSMNYPYPNPSVYYFLPQNNIPQPCYYLQQQAPLQPQPEINRKEQKTLKKVIDLEKPNIIKTEQVYSEKKEKQTILFYDADEKIGKNEKKVQKKLQKTQEFLQPIQTIKNQELVPRRYQLQLIFKKLLTSFVKESSPYNQCFKKTKEELQVIGELPSKIVLFEDLFENIKEKFLHFKKTKEELIKYIIRRTYHYAKHQKNSPLKYQFQRLEQFHDRNLKLHKSMNLEFLKKQFSNKTFLTFYQEFYGQLEAQFQEENDEKIDKLSNVITSAWMNNNISLIEFQKKLPWLSSYMKQIKTLAKDLYQKHYQVNESEGQAQIQ